MKKRNPFSVGVQLMVPLGWHIWYNAEFDHWKISMSAPNELLAVQGWKEFCYFAVPVNVPGLTYKNSHKFTHSPTGLTEYVYIGEL